MSKASPKCALCGGNEGKLFKLKDQHFHGYCLPDKEVNVQPSDGLEQTGTGTFRKKPIRYE